LLLVVIHILFLYYETLPLEYKIIIEPSFLYIITDPCPVMTLLTSYSEFISVLS